MGGDERVRVVVVTHCSASTIEDCLRRLFTARAVAEVMVIDNGSDDDTVARVMPLLATEPRLQLRCDPDNPGFASACNAGVVGASQPWLAFVNPDCLVEVDTFERLLAHARDLPDLGALGCVQIDAGGVEDAATRRRDPSLRRLLLARGARSSVHIAASTESLQAVDSISGAFMLIPAAVFARVGGFDPGYRLHAEDLDLCRRIRAAGLAIAVANDVRVVHLRGVSSRRRPAWVEWHKHRGLWRYFDKFEENQTSPPERGLLWCALWAHYAIAAPRAWMRARRGV